MIIESGSSTSQISVWIPLFDLEECRRSARAAERPATGQAGYSYGAIINFIHKDRSGPGQRRHSRLLWTFGAEDWRGARAGPGRCYGNSG